MSKIEDTQGIRQGYIAGVAEHEGVDYLESGAKFDRWLAKRDAEVAEAERERIVELLERTVMTVNMEWIVAIIEEEGQ